MGTLNQIIRERKKVMRQLKVLLKKVDSPLEMQERLIDRILQRKLKVPELSDLATLARQSGIMAAALRVYLQALNRGFPV